MWVSAGESRHVKLSLQIKELGKCHIYQNAGWTETLSHLQEHYSNEGHAGCAVTQE